jgi:exodeoxyribonuclease VII small subunit
MMPDDSRTETEDVEPASELAYPEAVAELDRIIAELDRGVVDVDRLEERLQRAVEIVEELDRRIRGARDRVESILPRLETVARRDNDGGGEDRHSSGDG